MKPKLSKLPRKGLPFSVKAWRVGESQPHNQDLMTMGIVAYQRVTPEKPLNSDCSVRKRSRSDIGREHR